MSYVLLDDHLLADVLADTVGPRLRRTIGRRDVATTNLYLFRLARAIVAGSGGALTSQLTAKARRVLGRQLSVLPEAIEVVPMRSLVFRMATIRAQYPVSTLGAEAIAAADALGARFAVWDGDDGPHIKAAARATGVSYVAVTR